MARPRSVVGPETPAGRTAPCGRGVDPRGSILPTAAAPPTPRAVRLRLQRLEPIRALDGLALVPGPDADAAQPEVDAQDFASFEISSADDGGYDAGTNHAAAADGAVRIDAGADANDGVADRFEVSEIDGRLVVSVNGRTAYTGDAADAHTLHFAGSADADQLFLDPGLFQTAGGDLNLSFDGAGGADSIELGGSVGSVAHHLLGGAADPTDADPADADPADADATDADPTANSVAADGLTLSHRGVEQVADRFDAAARTLTVDGAAGLHGTGTEGVFTDGFTTVTFAADADALNVQADALTITGALDLAGGDGTFRAESSLSLDADASLTSAGGALTLDGGDSLFVSGTVDVSNAGSLNGGQGGTATLLGGEITLTDTAAIDASGATGGGEIYVGGGLRGADPALPNAEFTTIAEGACLDASATVQGDGGTVVVWANDTTRFAGAIVARGAGGFDGTDAGDGGFAEVSGKQHVQVTGHADLRSDFGAYGTFLIDPGSVEIVTAATGGQNGMDTFTDAWINTQLSGSDLTITTSPAPGDPAATPGSGNGNPEVITVEGNVAIAWSAATTFTLLAGRSIAVNSGATVTATGDGAIVLKANQGGGQSAGANFTGVTIDGATLRTAGAGDLTIEGTGGASGDENVGVRLLSAVVDAAGTGAVVVTGFGGDGSRYNRGILVGGGSTIRAAGGDVTVEGTGGGSSDSNHGVLVLAGGVIEGGGAVSVTGEGGAGRSGNRGVYVLGAGSAIRSTGGAVTVTGFGGSNGQIGSDANHGVEVGGGGVIGDDGAGAYAGAVTVTGTGGAGGSYNYGVHVTGTDSAIRAFDADATVTGTGGANGQAGNVSNDGVDLSSGGVIEARGTGAVFVTGTGGAGEDFGIGVVVIGGAAIRSEGGGVTVQGTGRTNGQTGSYGNWGVYLSSGGRIEDTAAGAVSVTGQGGDGEDFNLGVFVAGAGSAIRAAAGDVTVEGTGGSNGQADSNDNYGVEVRSGGVIEATGTGAVSVTGTGGAGEDANRGVYVIGAGAAIRSAGGGVTLTGTGGSNGSADGSSNDGVHVSSAAVVEDAAAGAVIVTGTGGAGGGSFNSGVYVGDGGAVRAADGNVTVAGSGGSSGQAGSNDNQGVFLAGGGTVEALGAGAVSVTGTGGAGENFNRGVYVTGGGSAIRSSGGDVTVAGSSDGAGHSNRGVYLHNGGTIAAAGTTFVTGTGGTGVDAADANEGVVVSAAGSQILSTAGAVIVEGTGGDGPGSGNRGVYLYYGGLIQAAGTATVTGTGGNGSSDNVGVHVRGTDAAIRSTGGAVSVTGFGAGTGGANYGVSVEQGGTIGDDGTGTYAGAISVAGTGGDGVDSGTGVLVVDANSAIRSTGGGVTVVGTGRGTGTFNTGVAVGAGGTIEDIAAGAVFVAGTGGDGTYGNHGVDVVNDGTIQAAGGGVTVDGQGGAASSGVTFFNLGVQVFDGTIEDTAAGTVSVTGTGAAGSFDSTGVYVTQNSTIGSAGGAVTITGTGGVGAGAGSYGVSLDGSSLVSGAGVTIDGTADGGATDILLSGGAGIVSTTFAPITLDGATVRIDSAAGLGLRLDDDASAARPLAGADYSQVVLTGALTLSGGALSLAELGSDAALQGDVYVLIDNDGTDALVGQFSNLADGQILDNGVQQFQASYTGGDGNDLTLTALDAVPVTIDGAAGDDAFTVALDGADLVVTRSTDGGPVVEVLRGDAALLTPGGLVLNGLAGNDTLTVDYAGGFFTAPIEWNGGTQTVGVGDDLVLTGGGAFDSVTHTFVNASDGSVAVMLGAATHSVTYVGLEPVTDNLNAADRQFVFTGGAETITLSDDAAAGYMTIDSTLGESVTFLNPTARLTIDAGDGADTITIVSVDADYRASLTIDGGDGGDEVELAANLTLGSATSAGDVRFDAEAVMLTGGDRTITTTAGGANGAVTFVGTVDSDGAARALTVNSGSGRLTFGGDVGGASALASLTINAGGTTVLAAGVDVTTTGAQTYNSVLGVAGASVLTGTDATFNGRVVGYDPAANAGAGAEADGVGALTVTASGATTFNDVVGRNAANTANVRLASLTTDGGGTTRLNEPGGGSSVAPAVAATGTVQFDDDVVLGVDLSITVGGSILFGGTLESVGDASAGTNLTVGGGQTILFAGAVGATNRLRFLQTGFVGTTQIGTDVVRTFQLQSYNNAVVVDPAGTGVAGTVTFEATNGPVTFGNTLTAADAAGDSVVVIADAATFNGGAIGGTLTVTADVGNVAFASGTLAVTGNATVTAAAGAILGGADDGVADLTAAVIDLTANGVGSATTALDLFAAVRLNVDASAANGDVFVDGVGNLNLGRVNAGAGDATLAATGGIVDALPGDGAANLNVVATAVSLIATGGPVGGGGNVIDVAATSLSGSAGTGDFRVADFGGGLNLVSATADGDGSLGVTTTGGNLHVGAISAQHDVSLVAADGAITDANGAGTLNVSSATVQALAATDLDLDLASQVSGNGLRTTGTGDIAVRRPSGAFVIAGNGIVAADGDVSVTASAGDLQLVSPIVAGNGGTATLSASGAVQDSNGAANNVTAGSLRVTAGSVATTGDSLEIEVDTVAFDADGAVFLTDLSGGLTIGTVGGLTASRAGGGGAVTAANESLTIAHAVTVGGNFALTAGDDVLFDGGSLAATAGTATVTADAETNPAADGNRGSISQVGAGVTIVAPTLTLNAFDGIGDDGATDNALRVNVGTLNATNAGANDVRIGEADDVAVGSITNVGRLVSLSAGGAITDATPTVDDAPNVTAGFVALRAGTGIGANAGAGNDAADLDLAGGAVLAARVTGNGPIHLSADDGNADPNATEESLTIGVVDGLTGVSVAGTGDVRLAATFDLTISEAVTAAAGSMFLAADSDADCDGDLRIDAAVTAGAGGNLGLSANNVVLATDVTATGNGAIVVTACRTIVVNNGVTVSAEDGDVTLRANDGGANAGNFTAVRIDGGTVQTTGAGNVSVAGVGASDGTTSGNFGVFLDNGGVIAALGGGAVEVTGTGGAGEDSNVGVVVFDASEIRTAGGGVTVTGTGGSNGAAGSAQNYGVWAFRSVIEDTAAGAVAVTGLGGAGVESYGVFLENGAIQNLGTGSVVVRGDVTDAAAVDGIRIDGGTVAAADGEVVLNADYTDAADGSAAGPDNAPDALGTLALFGAAAVTAGGAHDVTIVAADVNLAGGAVTAAGDSIFLHNSTAGRTIGLGGGVGDFNLTDAEADRLTAAVLEIGHGDAAFQAGDVTVGELTLATIADTLVLRTGGNVVESGADAAADLSGVANLAIRADGRIGGATDANGDRLEVDVATLAVGGFAGGPAGGSVRIADVGGNLTLGTVADGAGTLTAGLRATGAVDLLVAGSLTVQNTAGATDLGGGALAAIAGGGITVEADAAIETDGGHAVLDANGGALTLAAGATLTTHGGDAGLEASGALTMQQAGAVFASVNTGGGNAVLRSQTGDVTLTRVNAGAGRIGVEAGGAIRDGLTGDGAANLNLIGAEFAALAATGVGAAANPLDVASASFAAETTAGDVRIDNFGVPLGTGDVIIGFVTVPDVIAVGQTVVGLTAGGLRAGGTVRADAPGGNLIVNAEVYGGVRAELAAGRGVQLNADVGSHPTTGSVAVLARGGDIVQPGADRITAGVVALEASGTIGVASFSNPGNVGAINLNAAVVAARADALLGTGGVGVAQRGGQTLVIGTALGADGGVVAGVTTGSGTASVFAAGGVFVTQAVGEAVRYEISGGTSAVTQAALVAGGNVSFAGDGRLTTRTGQAVAPLPGTLTPLTGSPPGTYRVSQTGELISIDTGLPIDFAVLAGTQRGPIADQNLTVLLTLPNGQLSPNQLPPGAGGTVFNFGPQTLPIGAELIELANRAAANGGTLPGAFSASFDPSIRLVGDGNLAAATTDLAVGGTGLTFVFGDVVATDPLPDAEPEPPAPPEPAPPVVAAPTFVAPPPFADLDEAAPAAGAPASDLPELQLWIYQDQQGLTEGLDEPGEPALTVPDLAYYLIGDPFRSAYLSDPYFQNLGAEGAVFQFVIVRPGQDPEVESTFRVESGGVEQPLFRRGPLPSFEDAAPTAPVGPPAAVVPSDAVVPNNAVAPGEAASPAAPLPPADAPESAPGDPLSAVDAPQSEAGFGADGPDLDGSEVDNLELDEAAGLVAAAAAAGGLPAPSRASARWRRRRDAVVREMRARDAARPGRDGRLPVVSAGDDATAPGSAAADGGELANGSAPETLDAAAPGFPELGSPGLGRSARRARRLAAAR